MTPNESIQCYQCGTRVTVGELVRNHDDCPQCGAAHTLKDVARAIELNTTAEPVQEEVEVVAKPAEVAQGAAVACLVRARNVLTPARLAHDSKDHFTTWGDWAPATLSYGKAVTDAGRNTPALYEMQLLYTAPPSPDAELVELLSDVQVCRKLTSVPLKIALMESRNMNSLSAVSAWISEVNTRVDAKLASLARNPRPAWG